MKTILLPLLVDESVEAALATAHMIAKRYGSYIEGLFIRSAPPMVPRAPVPAHFLSQYHDYWDENADKARESFSAFMNEHGIAFRELASDEDGPTAWWREIEGEPDDVVGEYGRLFDLIVMARASPKTSGEWSPLYDAALFDSGRPLLIAPETAPKTLGETVVIAWNASTETARTIAFAKPMLKDAKKVWVLSVEGAVGGMVSGPDGDQVAAHLTRGGINAVATSVQADRRSSGKAILEEAAALGADLLVKGAFTHNRLRQMIFGGTTRHVLAEAKLSVFIAH